MNQLPNIRVDQIHGLKAYTQSQSITVDELIEQIANDVNNERGPELKIAADETNYNSANPDGVDKSR